MDETPNTKVAINSLASTGIGTTSRIIRRSPPSQEPRKKRLNWPYVMLSLLIGTLLWFGVDLKRMEDMSMEVEIEYQRQLPADWQFASPPLRTARITVRGTRQEISGIRKEELMLEPEFPPGALDGDVYDGMLTLLPAQVRGLPPGIEVQSVSPPTTPIHLSKTITRYLTVEAGEITGAPQEGYAFNKVHQIDPPAMPVTASREFLAKIGPGDVIRTREFSVEDGKGLVGGMVALQPLEKDGEIVDVPGFVYMTVELDEIPVEREFEERFEVRALIDSPFDRYANLNISPPSVKVAVAGPKSVIDKLGAGEIVIYADIRDRVPAAPGEFNLKCKAITPSRVRVIRIEPDTVKWITRESGASASPDATSGDAGSKP